MNRKGNNNYSYEGINITYLASYIYEGTDEADINVALKNNGNLPWPKKETKLIYDKKSSFVYEDIILDPQEPNEEKNYKISFKNLKNFSIGEYKFILWFCVKGEKINDPIPLRIFVKEQNNNNDLKENMDKISEFRETFTLSKEEYSDEKLYEVLKTNNFDFDKSFQEII